jgi:hypothetical protein
MDAMTWRPTARAAMLAAAGVLAGCGGGGDGAEQGGEMRTVQAAPASDCGPTGCAPKRLTIQGRTLLDPQGRELRLRGVNVNGLDAAEGATIAGQFNMNTVRLRITYSKDTRADTPSGFKDDYLKNIDAWVAAARANGLWIVLEMRGSDAITNHPDFYDVSKTGACAPNIAFERCPNFGYYRQAWRFLAERYRGTDYIAGYGLLAEPSADKTGVDNPVATLVGFQTALMNAINQVDQRTPFFIGPNYNYDTMEYRLDDYFIAEYRGRVVYAVNFLMPKEWINNGGWTLPCAGNPAGSNPAGASTPSTPRTPGTPAAIVGSATGGSSANPANPACKPAYPFADPADGYASLLAGGDAATPPERIFNQQRVKPGNYQKTLSKGFIPWYLQWPLAFRDRHDVPLYVDQFGAGTAARGQLAYEGDLLDFFEAQGLHWTRWSYNAGDVSRRLLPPNSAVIDFYKQQAPRWDKP